MEFELLVLGVFAIVFGPLIVAITAHQKASKLQRDLLNLQQRLRAVEKAQASPSREPHASLDTSEVFQARSDDELSAGPIDTSPHSFPEQTSSTQSHAVAEPADLIAEQHEEPQLLQPEIQSLQPEHKSLQHEHKSDQPEYNSPQRAPESTLPSHDKVGASSHASRTETPWVPSSSIADELLHKAMAHLRRHWLVWIGAIALLIGMGFVVQFMGDWVVLSPPARMALAGGIALLTVAAGEGLHRKIQAGQLSLIDRAGKGYIPAGVVAAGMMGIYTTVILSRTLYQLMPVGIALVLVGVASLLCLWLSRRLGVLMAALGVLGGYLAPVMIGWHSVGIWVQLSYLLAIAGAAVATARWQRIDWLLSLNMAAFFAWVLALSLPLTAAKQPGYLYYLLPVAIYLLALVPIMGWRLSLRSSYRATMPWYHPAMALVGLFIPQFIIGSDTDSVWVLAVLLLQIGVVLVVPAIKRGFSMAPYREVVPLIALFTMLLVISGINHGGISVVPAMSLLGMSFVAVTVRQWWQYRAEAKSRQAYWQAILTTPLLTVLTLLSTLDTHDGQLPTWRAVFALLLAGLVILARVESKLRRDLLTAAHAMAAMYYLTWAEGVWLTLLLSAHAVGIAYQCRMYAETVRVEALKVALGLLVLRMTLVPFIPAWQSLSAGWLWIDYAPALLAAILVWLQMRATALRPWVEGSLAYVASLLVLFQTHGWITGESHIAEGTSLASVSLWCIEALLMSGFYRYRMRISDSLARLYQVFSVAALGWAGLCLLVMNLFFMPLWSDSVSGSDWPLLNLMLLGWLVPALCLGGMAKYQLVPRQLPRSWVVTLASALLGLWVLLSIRQFWQTETMLLSAPTGMAEWLSYSVVLMLGGVFATVIGIRIYHPQWQKVGLIIMAIAIAKVFLSDASYLDGLWRAMSFIGLGIALMGLGWLFQTLRRRQAALDEADDES
uniref:DUF2339 domain-containing protein n=1 Tax=Thaumasiovibrio occultus TaxID=1891184 RepID=UPI000B35E4C2|nr:DUF2339 domain-containing protein [Thaumasiovibrio occultus]